MSALTPSTFNNCNETTLQYVIIYMEQNSSLLATLEFDNPDRQVVEFTDDCDADSEKENAPFRRSLSTPSLVGGFRIQPTIQVRLEDLKRMTRIGIGSQSDVYKAYYKSKVVAVKVMRNHYENEIENLRKLKHRNIVRFIGACSESYKTYIVMEYCERGRLFDCLHKPDWQMKPEYILEWSYQVALGMSYLHRHNIIHRDLKSPNILINSNRTLKISDFGLSKPKLTKSAKMGFAGTVSWMSPEVIRQEACSETVDVWSFGVVLWELFFLQIPYDGFEQISIIFGVGNYTLSLPLPRSLPEPFRELITGCWNVDPTKRPSFEKILGILLPGGKKFSKFSMKKFQVLQQEWKAEYEEFKSKKHRFAIHTAGINGFLKKFSEWTNRTFF